MRRPRILVTNDDGLHGPGLRPLIAAMRRLGEVTAVVPDQERSADSHSLTLHKPVRVHTMAEGIVTLTGSPADCARFGILRLMLGKVDLVVSGINNGFNLGEDIIYSGTVAAAREARILGVPALAFSQDPRQRSFETAAGFARSLARQALRRGLAPGVILNVNFPRAPKGIYPGARAVRLGRRIYSNSISRRADPRGRTYYWLGGSEVRWVKLPGTDVAAVSEGFVSVTPLHLDQTDRGMLETLSGWSL